MQSVGRSAQLMEMRTGTHRSCIAGARLVQPHEQISSFLTLFRSEDSPQQIAVSWLLVWQDAGA